MAAPQAAAFLDVRDTPVALMTGPYYSWSCSLRLVVFCKERTLPLGGASLYVYDLVQRLKPSLLRNQDLGALD